MLRAWLTRIRTCVAGLTVRVSQRLDKHADEQTGKWGASLEYKRRYTNPDEAKRHRIPPAGTP